MSQKASDQGKLKLDDLWGKEERTAGPSIDEQIASWNDDQLKRRIRALDDNIRIYRQETKTLQHEQKGLEEKK